MAPRRYRMDRRSAAVDETRRRIVEATMALHFKNGISATSFEEIAREADVALATVYRHFPTLDQLIGACGRRVGELIAPPDPEQAADAFAQCLDRKDRIHRLVALLCDFYERGRRALELQQREAHLVPALEKAREASLRIVEAYVTEAVRGSGTDASSVRVICGLLDFRTRQALLDRGLKEREVRRVLEDLVTGQLGSRRKGTAASNKSVTRRPKQEKNR